MNKTLYHFTHLAYLPSVLREGITKGEVPVDCKSKYKDVPKAANLTENGNPDQRWSTCPAGQGKTFVRLTTEVPVFDLKKFSEVAREYNIATSVLKVLDPFYERRNWYFAFGGVSPSRIMKVEVWDKAYREVHDIDSLVSMVQSELQNFDTVVVSNGSLSGARSLQLKPGCESWLLHHSESVVRRIQGVLA